METLEVLEVTETPAMETPEALEAMETLVMETLASEPGPYHPLVVCISVVCTARWMPSG